MLDTSARLLRMLSLLQARPLWSGPELAERLEVTTRTVRRDVDRLRQLGYPVDAAPGVVGGYRMAPGAVLPPLLLDDDEATAVVLGLGALAGGSVHGVQEAALAALSKLDRTLPTRLRHRVAALRAGTTHLPTPGDPAEPSLLVTLAAATTGHERVALTYTDRNGTDSERRIEPYQLVSTGRRWYLVAHDIDRDDWRTFRVDRITSAEATGHRFTPRDAPDAAELVQRATSVTPYRWAATVRVDAPLAEIRTRVPATVGLTEAVDAERTILTTGADRLEYLAGHLVALGLTFEVLAPPELRAHLRAVGERLVAAHAGP